MFYRNFILSSVQKEIRSSFMYRYLCSVGQHMHTCTVITIENLPGRFYLFRKGRFSGAGWRYGQVLEKGGFDAKMT